ncbi:helicase C-terminal domain-containing protein [Lapidilactobacillus achengensis]|uniref:Helicase C-terminal domain-containing protein n=1 Tax=Lapidilactobacillus achengensis TaxID=2486000 RepID=A0ABW1UKM5_9LACO|nr:helicase C-terminal domain-containing protein [Lapidilactobacillus achengensis]
MVKKLGIRELIEFTLKSGDLVPQPSSNHTALEGARIHRRLQKQAGPDYQKEVHLTYETELDGTAYLIEGRADGVVIDPDSGAILVDEIKTSEPAFADLTADALTRYWGQAKFYAWLLAEKQDVATVTVQLTYFQTLTATITREQQVWSRTDLHDFATKVMTEYEYWLHLRSSWRARRNAAAATLAFPFPAFREQQHQFAGVVYKTIAAQKLLLAEAPTGTGKTIATLFPTVKTFGAELSERIFYLTAKTSTRQVAEETVQLLNDHGAQLKSVTITAKDKSCFMVQQGLEPQNCPNHVGYYDRNKDALKDLFAHENRWDHATIDRYAEKYTICPFEFSLDASLFADVIIGDYNYLFDPQVYLQRFFADPQPGSVFLIDEAHNLVSRSREMYSSSLDEQLIKHLKKEIRGHQSTAVKQLRRALKPLQASFKTLQQLFDATPTAPAKVDPTQSVALAPAKISPAQPATPTGTQTNPLRVAGRAEDQEPAKRTETTIDPGMAAKLETGGEENDATNVGESDATNKETGAGANDGKNDTAISQTSDVTHDETGGHARENETDFSNQTEPENESENELEQSKTEPENESEKPPITVQLLTQKYGGNAKRGDTPDLALLSEPDEDFIELLYRSLEKLGLWLQDHQESEFHESVLNLFFAVNTFLKIYDFYGENYQTIVTTTPTLKITLRCLDASEFLQTSLHKGDAAILFSATLTPLSYYQETLTAADPDSLIYRITSPFPPEHQGLWITNYVQTTYRQRETNLPRIVDTLLQMISARTGNYLVFLSSYGFLQQVATAFSQAAPHVKIIQQEAGSSEKIRQDFLAAFTHDPDETLVGFAVLGGAFSEGIDLQGTRLIGVAIVSVGLPGLSLENDLLRDYYQEKNGQGFAYAYQLPGFNNVLQASGRVIRGMADRGVILLIDQRFASGRYRQLFPPHWQRAQLARSPQELALKLADFWARQA